MSNKVQCATHGESEKSFVCSHLLGDGLKENALSPDTYPTQRGTARVPRVGECADKLCLAAIYPREEPDALMSARPGLCGGHRATGVPTAISNSPAMKHDPKACPLCGERIEKTARGGRRKHSCHNCGASINKLLMCGRCGTRRVWQGKKGSACSGCGAPYAG